MRYAAACLTARASFTLSLGVILLLLLVGLSIELLSNNRDKYGNRPDSNNSRNTIMHENSEDDKWVILFDPLGSNFVNKRGGLGQLYHLMERVVTLTPSKELDALRRRLYNAPNSSKNRSIIILFHEKIQIRSYISSLGRLMLSSLFAYRGQPLFTTMAFGYIKHYPRQSWYNADLSLESIHSAVIVFVTDISSQNSSQVFKTSLKLSLSRVSPKDIPHDRILRITLPENLSSTLEWFNIDCSEYLLFRRSIATICDDQSLYPSLYSETRSGRDALADHISPSHDKKANSLVPGMYSFEHKLYNTGWRNRSAGRFMENALVEAGTLPRKIVIYQRDKTRALLNVNHVLLRFRTDLIPSNWTVETLVHNENTAPCELLRSIASATALFTPHGFQSVLLLFQPIHSVLIEVHPKHAFSPEFYGFIQAGFRYNFKYGRSYLSEESAHSAWMTEQLISTFIKPLLDSHYNPYDDICRSGICMQIAKLQNVEASDGFINMTIDYLKDHFTQ
jgi:hypothetical protein